MKPGLSRTKWIAWRLIAIWVMPLLALLIVAAAVGAEPPKISDEIRLFNRGQGTVVNPTTVAASTNSAPAGDAFRTPTETTSAVTNNAMETLDKKHLLAIGDQLSFRIIEDEETPKPLFVTDSGDLEVPYIGRVPAVGKSCYNLALELKTELEKEYYYQATVIVAVNVKAKSRGKVYLVGPVRVPGPLDIPSDEVFTLSKAILRAGGFGEYADRRKVKVTRKVPRADSDKTFTVDVASVLEKGKSENDILLEPGDFIYIPERRFRF